MKKLSTSFFYLFLIAVCSLNFTKSEKNSPDYSSTILKFETPICVKVHVYVSKELYTEQPDKPTSDYTKQVLFEAQRIYAWHNIRLDYVEVVEWKDKNPFDIGETLQKTIDNFKDYLKEKHERGDNVHLLLVDFPSEETNVGLATLSGACTANAAAVVQTGDRVGFDKVRNAVAVAHEIGHVLGLEHVKADTADCLCSGESSTQCVMNDSTYNWDSEVPTSFHTCSIKALMDNTPLCLQFCEENNNMLHQCGNGIVDEGEECDCGFKESCELRGSDKCCDHTSCKLKESSMDCAEGECCKDCQFVTGTKCGTLRGECDLQDYCNGTTATCVNSVKPWGVDCEGDKGHCYRGTCSTPDNACSRLFRHSNVKYSQFCKDTLVELADSQGKCDEGFANKDLEYVLCSSGSPFCGTIWCELVDGEMNDPFYKLSLDSKSCYTVLDSTNPFTVMPSGVPCDKDKFCVGYLCETDEFYVSECEEPCPENMVCNHFLECVPANEDYFKTLPPESDKKNNSTKVKDDEKKFNKPKFV